MSDGRTAGLTPTDVTGPDTIVAIATAAGRGALAMVRASGPGALRIAARVLDPPPAVARRATRCVLHDGSGAKVDDVVATWFAAPRSFTGEDLVEITTHGGALVPACAMAAMIAAGARAAEPGEFTRRAVLHGKLDLLQAEAIGDLIDARSTAARVSALRQLDGGLSRRIESLRDDVVALGALLAYDIDFPEEDDGPVPRDRIASAAAELQGALGRLLGTAITGALVHEGALVVLAGPPNVGKSSLFNALLGEARAIVTAVPGTTRDAIEAVVDRPRWPIRLVDTAGLHDASDEVERLGVDAARRYLARAAVVLACGDSASALADAAESASATTSAPVLRVRTKADLDSTGDPLGDIAVSARTGVGLGELLAAVDGLLARSVPSPDPDAPLLTRARHQHAVSTAAAELAAFEDAWVAGLLPASVAAVHVRAACDALESLIGVVQAEDVLDAVFRRFCVGK